MNILKFLLLPFFICSICQAQVKRYKAKVKAMYVDYEGYVYLDLTGPNNGLIQVDIAKDVSNANDATRAYNFPEKKNASFKVNAGLINRVIIAKDTFYVYDLLDTYEKNFNRKHNCFLKKVSGNNDIILLKWKDRAGVAHHYIKLPNSNAAKSINHPFFENWNTTVYMGFTRCKEIFERFKRDFRSPENYPFYKLTGSKKTEAWKKLIDEYDRCELLPADKK
jgi:hypothetical protein